MGKTKQLGFFKDPAKNTKLWWIQKQQVYGGSLRYRKCQRPFDKNKLVHVVLKAHEWAAFHQRASSVQLRIDQVAKTCHVRVRDLAVNKDHVHVLITTCKRRFFLNFLRQVSAGLGHLMKQELGDLQIKKTETLWVDRPFTRLISWARRPLAVVRSYIHRNRQEVMGFLPYKARDHALNRFLSKWTEFSSA